MDLPSYPKAWNIGHPNTKKLFTGPVSVQEKIDGSQLSFGLRGNRVVFRSKRSEIYPQTDDNLFKGAVETVMEIHEAGGLKEGWTYRGESIWRPKHNALKYGRVPAGNVILFDIQPDQYQILEYDKLVEEAERIGLEVVPEFYRGKVTSIDQIKEFLERESVLGDVKIEGVVVKPLFELYGRDGKLVMGKHVSEAFKEKHRKAWNPGKNVVDTIIDSLRTKARWKKAIQHRREDGDLLQAPQDIGPLIKDIQDDIEEEEEEYIKDMLYKDKIKQIRRGVIRGFPEFYKQLLLEEAFDEEMDLGGD